MPMTKTIQYYCPFCLQTVRSLEKHAKEKHVDLVQYSPGAKVDTTGEASPFGDF